MDIARLSRLLRSLFFEDLVLKFFCVVLAVLLWIYIDGELMALREIDLPLQASQITLPPGAELAPGRLPSFKVELRGQRQRLQFITAEDVTFNPKLLENLHSGRNPLQVQPSDFTVRGVDVTGVTPEEAAIVVVATTNAKKAVRVKPVGDPKAGYVVDQPVVDPAEVSIEVADQDRDAFSFVYTDEVDIAGADHDVTREVGIQPGLDVDGRHIAFHTTEKVRATIPIRPVMAIRPLTFDVRTYVPPGAALLVDPQSVQLEVVAAEQDLANEQLMAHIAVYVRWPAAWDTPKSAGAILGPLKVTVETFAPPHVQVRGINDGPLPTVEIRGMMMEGKP